MLFLKSDLISVPKISLFCNLTTKWITIKTRKIKKRNNENALKEDIWCDKNSRLINFIKGYGGG